MTVVWRTEYRGWVRAWDDDAELHLEQHLPLLDSFLSRLIRHLVLRSARRIHLSEHSCQSHSYFFLPLSPSSLGFLTPHALPRPRSRPHQQSAQSSHTLMYPPPARKVPSISAWTKMNVGVTPGSEAASMRITGNSTVLALYARYGVSAQTGSTTHPRVSPGHRILRARSLRQQRTWHTRHQCQASQSNPRSTTTGGTWGSEGWEPRELDVWQPHVRYVSPEIAYACVLSAESGIRYVSSVSSGHRIASA